MTAEDAESAESLNDFCRLCDLGFSRRGNAGWSKCELKTPHIAKPPGPDVVFHFAQNIVELSVSDIALHLLIPFIIFPTMQPRGELSALFERELLDCSFDFSQTIWKLSASAP